MTYSSYLLVNHTMKGGEHKVSPNGKYLVMLGEDGDLLVCRGSDPHNTSSVLWETGPHTEYADSVELTLQDDGNLVVYVYQGSAKIPIWASQTKGIPVSFLKICDDGNLVIYQQNADKTRTQGVWASNVTDHTAMP